MNRIFLIAASLALSTSSALAEPFQFEALVGMGKTDLTQGGSTLGVDQTQFGLTYYLRPVDTNNGPLAEAAFVTQSASVSAAMTKSEADNGGESDILTFEGRFVTEDNLILILGYDKYETNSGLDTADTLIGAGKYLDNRTTAEVTLELLDDVDDTKIIKLDYRKLMDRPAANTYMAIGTTLGYIDGSDDSGYLLSGELTYYPSKIASIGVIADYSSIGDLDTNAILVEGQYFISPKLVGSAFYGKANLSDTLESDTMGASISFRF